MVAQQSGNPSFAPPATDPVDQGEGSARVGQNTLEGGYFSVGYWPPGYWVGRPAYMADKRDPAAPTSRTAVRAITTVAGFDMHGIGATEVWT